MPEEGITCLNNIVNMFALHPTIQERRKQWYRKTSSISRTKSQSLNVSCIIAQLSSLKPLNPGVKLRMKMLLEQRRQEMLQLHLSYQHYYCLQRCDLC